MEHKVQAFLTRLVKFYPTEDNTSEKTLFRLNEYKNTLIHEINKLNCQIDYDRLFDLIKLNYKFKVLPSIPYIVEKLQLAKLYKSSLSNEGKTLMVIINNNGKYRVTDYVIRSCNAKINDVLERERKIYGDDNVIVKMFPAGWHHIGNKAYAPTDDDSAPVELYKV